MTSSHPIPLEALPVRPGDTVGGYRVDRVLGAGSMGVVVAATHLELERAVVIKFLCTQGFEDREARERFRREAQAAAKIRGEHVTRVLDVGSTRSGVPFMVLELLEGRSLKEELAERGALSVSEAVGYVLEAAEGLAEAHAAGIIHRDLKPENLFLARRPDGSRIVKILDFGISKWTHAGSLGLTQTGMVMGSPLYMPPEQLESTKSVDARADVWALGAVLFELLTTRVPFEAQSIPELYSRLRHEAAPLLSMFGENFDAALENVIARCLARDREARFQTVVELAEALAPFAPESVPTPVERERFEIHPGETHAPVASPAAAGTAAPASSKHRAAWIWAALVGFALIGIVLGLGRRTALRADRAQPAAVVGAASFVVDSASKADGSTTQAERVRVETSASPRSMAPPVPVVPAASILPSATPATTVKSVKSDPPLIRARALGKAGTHAPRPAASGAEPFIRVRIDPPLTDFGPRR